jgi:hypothetical protein
MKPFKKSGVPSAETRPLITETASVYFMHGNKVHDGIYYIIDIVVENIKCSAPVKTCSGNEAE